MSPTTATPPSAGGGSKPMRILACVLCQHRKIKCDRSFPCANCLKANVTCTPSTPAPARKRRRPNQDLQERLARCEELLKQYATAKPEATSPQPPADGLVNDAFQKWKPAGKLVVEDDGVVHFVDSMLLGTVYDELKAMREIVDVDDNDDATPETMSATPDENADLLTGGSPPNANVEELQPAPGHVFRLWQIFLERVNPLTKIIHVPTLQPYLVEAASGSPNIPIPKNIEALLFAIYTIAVVSMKPDECQSLLGYSRDVALQRFSSGVRISLNQLGFLKTHDLETLQALLIYMLSLQGRYNKHAAWILNGVAIRIAQKMGLHKDGELLGLSPFDTEMRRRVWWQLIMADAKYSIFSGLSHSLLPRGWDTKEPKNINDADLFPSTTEPIQDRDGPTEMIMVLLTNKVAKFLVATPGIEPMILISGSDSLKLPNGPTQEQLEAYRQIVSKLGMEMLDVVDKYSDPNAGPLHEMACDTRQQVIEKMGMFLKQPGEDEFADELVTPNDFAFKIAIKSGEHEIEHHATSKDKAFSWYARQHFQLNIFQYVVGQLCHRRTGRLVDRAWEVVQACYDLNTDLFDTSGKAQFRLASIVLRAWAVREEVLRGRLGHEPETPDYVLELRRTMPQEEDKSCPSTDPASADMSPLKDEMVVNPSMDQLLGPYFDTTNMDWDAWGTLATGPAIPAFGGFGMGPTTEW